MKLLKIINKNLSFYPIQVIDNETFFICSDLDDSYKTLYDLYDLQSLQPQNIQIQDYIFIGKQDYLLCFQGDFDLGRKTTDNVNIYDVHSGKILRSFKTEKRLSNNHINSAYPFATYQEANNLILTGFDPFTERNFWKMKAVTVELSWQNHFLSIDKNILTCHSSQTGEVLWSFDVSDYLMKDIPLQNDGEPLFKAELETALYNPVHEMLLVRLCPDKLLAIDAKNGGLVWVKDIPSAIQWRIDENTGNIYLMAAANYLENYIEDDGRTRQVRQYTCIYHHVEGSTGETLLQRDLKEVIPPKYEDGTARTLNFHHFAGYKDDSLYLSLFGEGELYKLNKHTGELEESYIHDRNFESAPIIHQNRLFLTDPTADDKTRLLVFEI